MRQELSIQTDQLGRIYKIRGSKKEEARELVALQNVSLEVPRGELFGLLGPNGAGKTTLIKILTTLLSPTSGWARVAGFDVANAAEKVRPLINMVSGGEASGYGLLTVRENLWMFSQFYGMASAAANRRITELLDIVGLADRANTKSSDLSTGLRQKMNIVRGFLTDPEVLFLDEPTLGLDVGAARDVRQFISQWIDQNPTRTILLTTHYMVEAEEMCHRVAIINKGRVLACDTPANLKRDLRKEPVFRIEVSPLNGLSVDELKSLPQVLDVAHQAEDGRTTLEFTLSEEAALAPVVSKLTQQDIRILNLQKREPSLEDVFVELVGRSMEEIEHGSNPKG